MLNYNFAVATAELQNNKNHIQNFRMWFKFGLKAQKLLAQGIALGINVLFRCEAYAVQDKMMQVLILSGLKNIRQFWETELAWIP